MYDSPDEYEAPLLSKSSSSTKVPTTSSENPAESDSLKADKDDPLAEYYEQAQKGEPIGVCLSTEPNILLFNEYPQDSDGETFDAHIPTYLSAKCAKMKVIYALFTGR